MVVAADKVPEAVPVEVPWMVIVEVPGDAVLLAVRVSTLLLVVGLVPKEAITPLGIPEAVSVTLPVNPPTSVMLMVSVAPALGERVRVGAEDESVKLPAPAAVTISVMVVVDVMLPDVPTIVKV
jgi:hypothetical protein